MELPLKLAIQLFRIVNDASMTFVNAHDLNLH